MTEETKLCERCEEKEGSDYIFIHYRGLRKATQDLNDFTDRMFTMPIQNMNRKWKLHILCDECKVELLGMGFKTWSYWKRDNKLPTGSTLPSEIIYDIQEEKELGK